jgi:hypothetical protein
MRSPSHILVSSLLVVAACSSAPTPDPLVVAAPIAETSMPMFEAAGSPSAVAVDLSYVRSPTIAHSWRAAGVGRVQVALELSCSAPAIAVEDMQVMLELNWDAACATARGVCEQFDLTTEDGQQACDAELCAQLSATLFGMCDDPAMAQVERVVWKRIRWN